MFFLGNTFLGSKYSIDPSQVYVPNINHAKLSNSIFDDIFITSNPNHDFSQLEWSFSTVLWAKFKESLSAGNITESLSDIHSVLIKRRRKGAYGWLTLFEIPILDINSLRFERFDRYVANNVEYEYALVFMLNDIEGSYNINNIKASFGGIFITNKDRIFSSIIEAYTPKIQKNHPTSIVPTIDARYPFVASNSINNYYSGNVTGVFVEHDLNKCELKFEEAFKYRNDFMDFLCDGTAKMLKLEDGRIYMICVIDSPTETHEMNIPKVTTEFSWIETGDCENTLDLHDNDFIDVTIVRR